MWNTILSMFVYVYGGKKKGGGGGGGAEKRERERSVGFLFRNSFPKNGWII